MSKMYMMSSWKTQLPKAHSGFRNTDEVGEI